jgi:hypothetical protein
MKKKTLALKKITLRDLDTESLEQMAGGTGQTYTVFAGPASCSCDTFSMCTSGPCTFSGCN